MTAGEVILVLSDRGYGADVAGVFALVLSPLAFLLCGARMIWDGHR